MSYKFKAIKHVSLNKFFFIKIYKNEEKQIKNQAVESELIMKDIKHDNLINMISYIKYKDHTCFFYKYYDCIDLITIYENMNEFYLNFIELVKFDISQQLINIVNYLHHLNICHRDIKLDNILLYGDKILLCDFEYSVKCNNLGFNVDIKHKHVGTLNYMPPEIINYKSIINFKNVDIWNTGIVIYILLSKGSLIEYNTFRNWKNIYCKDIIENLLEWELVNLTEFKIDCSNCC